MGGGGWKCAMCEIKRRAIREICIVRASVTPPPPPKIRKKNTEKRANAGVFACFCNPSTSLRSIPGKRLDPPARRTLEYLERGGGRGCVRGGGVACA